MVLEANQVRRRANAPKTTLTVSPPFLQPFSSDPPFTKDAHKVEQSNRRAAHQREGAHPQARASGELRHLPMTC